MKNIQIYDLEAERIKEICEKHGMTPAELIELLLDEMDDSMDEICS